MSLKTSVKTGYAIPQEAGVDAQEDRELTRRLRPKWRRQAYGIVALTIGVALYLLVLLARAAFASPPTPSQRSLLAAARPKVIELRRNLAGTVWVAEAHGMYLRASECSIGNIIGARVQHGARGSITGLVTVACVWKSPDQRTFQTPEDAYRAELDEEEPGKLRLTFAWTGGHWQYKGAKKE